MVKKKLKKILTVRNVISLVTLLLVGYVVYSARNDISDALTVLSRANLGVMLLLIPVQLVMYYCLGQIFFSYIESNLKRKIVSKWTLARISFELNFVNHAIPSGGVSGLGYMVWRLGQFGVSAGQTSFMYIMRYFITITVNQLQTLVAVVILIMMNQVRPGFWWIVWLTVLASLGIISLGAVTIVIASKKKRIKWFVSMIDRVSNAVTKFLKKPRKFSLDGIEHYFMDIHKSLMDVRKDRKLIVKPIIWGTTYGMLEIGVYWVVAISMGFPYALPQIAVAQAIASVVGAVLPTPGGAGGYEGVMIMAMVGLGMDAWVATAIVMPSRVIVLVGTIVSGYGFYQHAISTVGKNKKRMHVDDFEKIGREIGEGKDIENV